ncbi:ankyrin repeat and SAM domain-containing protein 6-like isoform X1 [Ornithodoros turicata]|uniref:ankyrin repeat and SAM domain-containing protein 6-like isoform X1 n=1 Tax=Ornithodoros turicata TaxID=34597 RepID=UPI00313A1208
MTALDRAHQLLSACLENDVVTVSTCLNNGLSVNEQDFEGTAPLHVAAANGYESLVESLISRGAEIDLPNASGWTALMQAARHGHTSVVSLLLKRGANGSAVNKLGIGLLSLAASSGHRSTVQVILNVKGVSTEDVPWDSSEMTPMMSAALFGHVSIIGLLLTSGASVNSASSTTGRSPLMLSSCNGHKESVELLVELGADTNCKDIRGRTALDIAVACGKSEVATYLSDKTLSRSNKGQIADNVDIINAVKEGDFKQTKNILQKDRSRANWSCPKTGMTPLMYAAILGHQNIAMLLLENGCEMDKQDCVKGWTALMHAVFNGNTSMISCLLKARSNIGISAHNGATALDMSCYLDTIDPEVPELLVKIATTSKHAIPVQAVEAESSGKYKGTSDDDTHQTKTLKELLTQVTQRLLKSKPPVLKAASSTTEVVTKTRSSEALDTVSVSERIPALNLLSFTTKPLEPHRKNVPIIQPPQPLHGNLSRKIKKMDTRERPARKADGDDVNNLPKGWEPTVLLDRYLKPAAISGVQGRRMSHLLALSAMHSTNTLSTRPEANAASPRDLLDVPSTLVGGHLAAPSTSECVPYFSGTIRELLKRLHLEQYAANFKEHEVDLDTFVDLNTRDLENIGIPENSIKLKLLEVIKAMRNQTLL